jgi:hypothetical protein
MRGAPIEGGDTRDETLHREALFDQVAAGPTETLSECLVGEEREELRSKVSVIRRAMEETGVPIDDDLGDASDHSHDDGRALRHCLDDDVTESLEVGGQAVPGVARNGDEVVHGTKERPIVAWQIPPNQ